MCMNVFKFYLDLILINLMKSNELFYEKIFSYANVMPQKAIVVDDNPQMLFFAQKVGAKVIHSCLNGKKPEFENYFTKPEELSQVIKEI